MPDKSREIGRVDRGPGSKFVVSVNLWHGQVRVDVREWIETPAYTGLTKKGVSAKPEVMLKVAVLLQEAIATATRLAESEAKRRPLAAHRQVVASETVDRLILGRALGEQIPSLAAQVHLTEDDVWQLLEQHAEQCPNCGKRLGTDGNDAYVCSQCAARSGG
jgi:hypothetical protein